ncbi:hypothetical protein ACFT9I_16620 [Streptomyces sp. NPDC057137]|uniref:hypothetical protein n=1 Tax=Streptomyces sp. NPDC057137 TaxID=3346030 RepID=UPI00363E9565
MKAERDRRHDDQEWTQFVEAHSAQGAYMAATHPAAARHYPDRGMCLGDHDCPPDQLCDGGICV